MAMKSYGCGHRRFMNSNGGGIKAIGLKSVFKMKDRLLLVTRKNIANKHGIQKRNSQHVATEKCS